MPAFADVALPAEPGYSTAFAMDAGYGWTEAIQDEGGGHDRVLGSLAASLRVSDWLFASGEVRGRFDKHPDEDGQPDSGATGLPGVRLRAFAGNEIQWGADLGVWLPGNTAPSIELAAMSPELRGLFGYQSSSGFALGANLGYRLDNGERTAPDAATLRPGDRIALGVSEYDAALVGLGAGYHFGWNSVFGEVSADVLLGAARAATSPLRATAGVRRSLTAALQLEARATLGLSERPSIAPDAERIPIEPRLLAVLGLRILVGAGSGASPPPEPDSATDEPAERVEAPPVEAQGTLPSVVRGLIEDAEGRPLAQVDVTLTAGATRLEAITGLDGRFAFDRVPMGEAVLEAVTVDYEPLETTFEVSGDGRELSLPKLVMKLQTLGAQLQCLVQTFDGKPLVANITITPPGTPHQTDADGRLTIDVAPGDYEVLIAADGYVSQKHRVVVREKAVVVVNADLRKAR